jgi:hypothetical protein
MHNLQVQDRKFDPFTVNDGRRVYSELLDYRENVRMSGAEASLLQMALDLLRARLRFFGEPV